jgi:hypothetical protein
MNACQSIAVYQKQIVIAPSSLEVWMHIKLDNQAVAIKINYGAKIAL